MTGKMTLWRAKCSAKVVHKMETVVLNFQPPVRISRVRAGTVSRCWLSALPAHNIQTKSESLMFKLGQKENLHIQSLCIK